MNESDEVISEAIQDSHEQEAEKASIQDRLQDVLFADEEADPSESGPSESGPSESDTSVPDTSESDWAAADHAERAPDKHYESMAEIQGAHQQLAQAAGQFQAQVNAVDWNRLRQDDPAQYAIAMQEKLTIQNAIAQEEQRLIQSAQDVQGKHIETERAKLLKAIPEWRDKDVAAKEQPAIRAFLKGKGYTDREINGVSVQDVVNARNWMQTEKRVATQQKVKRVGPKAAAKPSLGIDPDKEMYIRDNARRFPGGPDEIALRLMEGGHV